MPFIMGGMAAAGIGGSLAGHFLSQGDRDKASAAQQAALQQILGVQTPDINQMMLELENYKSAGLITPEMENSILLGQSQMGNISTDPRLKQAQMQALGKLQNLSNGGLQPEDAAALAQMQRSIGQQAHAQDQSIIQNMQQRGQAGSGSELAMRLQSSQAAADRANQQGLGLESQASQRALQAIMNAGSLGGQMQSQEFNQAAAKAQAADAIARFNAQNQQNVSNQNVAMRNQAQGQNLANQQNLMNQNTGLHNAQQQYNKNLLQQDYMNKLQRAQAASGAYTGYANNMLNQAQNTANMWNGIGQGASQGIGAYGMSKAMQNKQNSTPTDFTGYTPTANENAYMNNYQESSPTDSRGYSNS